MLCNFTSKLLLMITTLIFDLDGTLLNTIKDLALSCNHVLKQHGFPEHTEDEYRYFVGNGMAKLVERALPEDKRTSEFIEPILKELINYYYQHKQDNTQPYDGVKEMLQKLQSENYKLAVASNKMDSAVQDLVKRYFPEIQFSVVYGQREDIHPKPAPRIIQNILDALQIEPYEALIVGDSATDMLTAINSGIKGIGVQWGFRTKEELLLNGANYTIKTPSQIFEILQVVSH